MDEDMIIAQQLLSEAKEKLNLLKNNAGQLPVREVLVLASSIRDKLRDNQALTNACDNDATIAELRKRLLEDILVWQLKLIEDIVSNNSDDTVLLGQITDFDKAKKAMVEMIEAEQSKQLFEETEAPKLMEGIADCKKHTATICRVAENCKNGKFLALVLGDFQSGKSTTIDALCDGRHITAIGDGTATSAVLVMVSYGNEESLQIYWREKEQFLPIFDRIKRVMPEYDWVSFDLEKRDERIKLANAIGQIRQRGNKSIKGQTLDQGDVKFLMLCDLILAFYGTEVLQAKKASLLSISNISDITRFPKDGETKWKKDGAKGFTIDEAIFVFINSVSCTTPSETLKKLNCTIVDSPGLFNSAYDTMVTESAMVAAHAIIYVLPYYKGIGQNVCGSLYDIKNRYPDVHKKLFIVNNIDSLKENAFVESNCAFIKAQFGSEKVVYVYDAKVSYLAQLKHRYDMGLATDTDFAHLMHANRTTPLGEKELKFRTFDEAWAFYMNSYKTAYGTSDESPVDIYLNESGFIALIAALKTFIEKNQAYAVILSNALIPMYSELMAIKRELGKRYIEPYMKSHEEMTAIWSMRISKACEFQEYSTNLFQAEVFGHQNGTSVCDRLSEEEYGQIFTSGFYGELATGIAEVLYDNKSKFLASQAMRAIREDTTITIFPPRVKFKDNGQFQKVFGDLVTPLIKEKICELISRRMKYVLEMIETGQDGRVSSIFTPVADKIKLMLEREWEKKFKDDNTFKMIDYLSIPRDLKGCVRENTSDETSGADFTSDLSIGATLLSGVVVQITAVVTGIAAMIAGYIGFILCDPTFTALIACVLLGIGGAIVSLIAPEYVRDKFVEFLVEKVEPKLRTDARSGFAKIVEEQVTAILDRYVKARVVNINKMKNERDVALAPNPNQEVYCFRSLEVINKVSKQLSEYEAYKDLYVKDETN